MTFEEFNALHRSALEKNEAKHNVILWVMANALTEDPPGQTRKWSFGEPGACAAQSKGRGILLGELNEEQCRALAREVAGTDFHGVGGADQTALWFVDEAQRLGEMFKEPMPQWILAISEPPKYPAVPGEARTLTAEDSDLFAEWGARFMIEAAPEDDPPSRNHLDKKAASGDVLLWVADGRPISMAGIVRRLRNASALAWVYTPPEQRARGYAGAATASVVDKIYTEGRATACLYVDQRNPASNRCYERIGFKPVCESSFFFQLKEPLPLQEMRG